MVGVMIVAFIVAWTPYATLALVIQFGDASNITPGLAVMPALVAKSSICYNPVIYVGLNTQVSYSYVLFFVNTCYLQSHLQTLLGNTK